jgi:hypothetical protein
VTDLSDYLPQTEPCPYRWVRYALAGLLLALAFVAVSAWLASGLPCTLACVR